RFAAAPGEYVSCPATDRSVPAADWRLLRRPRSHHRAARLPEGRTGPAGRCLAVRGRPAATRGPGMTNPVEKLLLRRRLRFERRWYLPCRKCNRLRTRNRVT